MERYLQEQAKQYWGTCGKCEHRKVYSTVGYSIAPWNMRWICEKCGTKGADEDAVFSTDRYNKIVEEFNSKCEHDKIYSVCLLLTSPPQRPWICRKCGEQGNDDISAIENTYEETVRQFKKKGSYEEV